MIVVNNDMDKEIWHMWLDVLDGYVGSAFFSNEDGCWVTAQEIVAAWNPNWIPGHGMRGH